MQTWTQRFNMKSAQASINKARDSRMACRLDGGDV